MQPWFVTHRKKLEEMDFVDEEFLHKKVDKMAFIWGLWCATEDIPENTLRQPESSIMEIWQYWIEGGD